MEECIYKLIENYVKKYSNVISYPNYKEIIMDDLMDILFEECEKELKNKDVLDELIDNIEYAMDVYFDEVYLPKRQVLYMEKYSKYDKDVIEKLLKKSDINEQRSVEWYLKRHELITASNAYKVFGSDAVKNQLIYEKCMSIRTGQSSVESLKWGRKYECVSQLIYEDKYKTRVSNMGCIIHPEYSFLGASPDGINVDEESKLYGILIEIKNVVSREINGIPKMEYWIQMQIQMECCDINECHFIETKISEYKDKDEYLSDTEVEYKGRITELEEGIYRAEILKKNEYIELEKVKYWRLEKMNIVVIERNKEWFNKNIEKIKEIWEIIQKEKVEGFEHRKPKSKKCICLL